MVDHRKELTAEVLSIDSYPAVRGSNLLIGACVGFFIAEPLFAFYYMLTLPFPALPISKNFFWISKGVIPVVGMAWGYIGALKYEGVSVRFNRDSITLYKDCIAKRQILWSEVTSVKRNWNVMIEARQGPSIEIPLAVLNAGTYEARSLSNQLRKFNVAPKNFNANKLMAWGAVLLVAGFALLISFPKAKNVFEDSDPGQISTWLRVLPSTVGALSGIIGVHLLGFGVQMWATRKKPSRYLVNDIGISLKEEQLPWDEVVEIQRMGSQDRILKIIPRTGKPWEINCLQIIDGETVRDSILAHSPTPSNLAIDSPKNWSGEPIVSTISSDQRVSFVILGFFTLVIVVIAVGSIGFGWLANRPNEPPVMGYFFAFGALFLVSLLLWASRTVTISREGLTCKWLIGVERKIRFADIKLVEMKTVQSKDRTRDVLEVRSNNAKILLSSSATNFAQLRDILLAIVPGDKVRMS